LIKEELPEQWKESIVVSIYNKGVETVIIEVYHYYQLFNARLSKVHRQNYRG
jgi:hypothetical protein